MSRLRMLVLRVCVTTLLLGIASISAFGANTSDVPGPYLPLALNPPPPTATPIPPTATATPRPTAVPTATPALPPPSYNGCKEDPNPAKAPNYPIRIVNIDPIDQSVVLENVSDETVVVEGWHLCSINGNEEQNNFYGWIQPHSIQGYTYTGGVIWSRTDFDDGALYNDKGQLVAYFKDKVRG